MKTTALLLLLLATTLGCSSDSAPISAPSPSEPAERVTSDDVLGHDWRLLGFVIADALLDSAVGAVTLTFEADGSLGGSGGCNRYGGAWTRGNDEGLVIGNVFSTAMACAEPDGIMQQEGRYFDALSRVTHAERLDDRLHLRFNDTGDHMVFELIVREQVPPEPFTQIWWQLDSFEIADRDAVSLSAALPGATIFFGDDGNAHGSTGCNQWFGEWHDGDDGQLRFRGVGATKRACAEPQGIMAQEARLLDALSRITRIVSITGEITLYTGDSDDGIVSLRFVPRSDSDIRSIRGGTSFGECLGYCWEELHVDGKTTHLRNGGRDRETPVREARQAGNVSRWYTLAGLVNLNDFLALEEVIGCPDCADGGAEWIEIETGDGARRVTYEYGNPPKPIVDLARALQDLRGQLRDQLVVATVVLE